MQIIESPEHKRLGKLTKPIFKEIVNPPLDVLEHPLSQKERLIKEIRIRLEELSERQLLFLLDILSRDPFV